MTKISDDDPTTIIRHTNHTDRYTICVNATIKDRSLSWQATGMLVYLLGLPPHWKIILSNLVDQKTDGLYCVRATLAELIERGYVQRRMVRDEGKISEWVIEVRESLDIPWPESPVRGFRDVENQDQGNRTLVSTEVSNDVKSSNDVLPICATDVAPRDRFDEFWDAFGLKRDPKSARAAWAKACKKADPDHLIAIAAQYHAWCIAEEVSQKYAQGWLNDERWNDELTSRRHRTKVERNRAALVEGIKNIEQGDTFEARMKRAGEIGRAREQLTLTEGTNQ